MADNSSTPAAPIEHALQLIAEGADIIDIGGESTRPDAAPVAEAEELSRVLPVIRELMQASRISVPISIDTMKPAVARAAIEAGASIVNDVAGNRGDLAMWQLVRETKAGVCADAHARHAANDAAQSALRKRDARRLEILRRAIEPFARVRRLKRADHFGPGNWVWKNLRT